MKIDNIDLDGWISELKPYQISTIKSLVNNYGEEEAINKWLLARGPLQTATFGGDPIAKDSSYSERFKKELAKFICGHPDYDSLRENIKSKGDTVNKFTIPLISAAIGDQMGLTQGLLVPVVAVALSTISKISINAYCANKSFD